MIVLYPINSEEKTKNSDGPNLEHNLYNENNPEEFDSEYIIKFSEEIDLKKGVGLVPLPTSNIAL